MNNSVKIIFIMTYINMVNLTVIKIVQKYPQEVFNTPDSGFRKLAVEMERNIT